jgi:BlaI family penicillinase repressor
MPRENPLQPSDAEWKVLHALWRRGKATSRELLDELVDEKWAYTTLKTMLTRMEEKRFVRSRNVGNAAQYEALLARGSAQRSALKDLLERVFEGASGALLAHLAEDEKLSAKDRAEIEQRLRDAEAKGSPKERRRGR